MIGWTKLTKPLVAELTRRGCNIAQIKEKFGELRVYVDYPDDMTHEEQMFVQLAIDGAEAVSRTICIACGAPAKMCTDGWVLPLCQKHASDNNRVWPEPERRVFGPTWYQLTEEELNAARADY